MFLVSGCWSFKVSLSMGSCQWQLVHRRLNSAERFNPMTGAWEALPPMQERRHGSLDSVLFNQKGMFCPQDGMTSKFSPFDLICLAVIFTRLVLRDEIGLLWQPSQVSCSWGFSKHTRDLMLQLEQRDFHKYELSPQFGSWKKLWNLEMSPR